MNSNEPPLTGTGHHTVGNDDFLCLNITNREIVFRTVSTVVLKIKYQHELQLLQQYFSFYNNQIKIN
jgi:hypothetical protein